MSTSPATNVLSLPQDLIIECVTFLDPAPHLLRLRLVCRAFAAALDEYLKSVERLDLSGLPSHTLDYKHNRAFEDVVVFIARNCTKHVPSSAVETAPTTAAKGKGRKAKQPQLPIDSSKGFQIIDPLKEALQTRGGTALSKAYRTRLERQERVFSFKNTTIKSLTLPMILHDHHGITRAAMTKMLTGLQALEELTVFGFYSFSSIFGEALCRAYDQKLSFPSVKRITLVMCAFLPRYAPEKWQPNQEFPCYLPEVFPNLEYILNISPNDDVSNAERVLGTDPKTSKKCGIPELLTDKQLLGYAKDTKVSKQVQDQDPNAETPWTRQSFFQALNAFIEHKEYAKKGQIALLTYFPRKNTKKGSWNPYPISEYTLSDLTFLKRVFDFQPSRRVHGKAGYYSSLPESTERLASIFEYAAKIDQSSRIVLANLDIHMTPLEPVLKECGDICDVFSFATWNNILLDGSIQVANDLLNRVINLTKQCSPNGKLHMLSANVLRQVLDALATGQKKRFDIYTARVVQFLEVMLNDGWDIHAEDYVGASTRFAEVLDFFVKNMFQGSNSSAASSASGKKKKSGKQYEAEEVTAASGDMPDQRTLLHKALRQNSIPSAFKIITMMKKEAQQVDGEVPSLIYADETGLTPFHIAIASQQALANNDLMYIIHQIHSGNYEEKNPASGNNYLQDLLSVSLFHLADMLLKELKEGTANGIDINHKNNVGQSALHIAVCRGFFGIQVAKVLVQELGADISITDNTGNTANDLYVDYRINSAFRDELEEEIGWLTSEKKDEDEEMQEARPARRTRRKRQRKASRDEDSEDEEAQDDEEKDEEPAKPDTPEVTPASAASADSETSDADAPRRSTRKRRKVSKE